MFQLSPAIKVSLGLVLLTLTMLLMADFFGLIPDERHAQLESRKTVAESIAFQTSAAIESDWPELVTATFKNLVQRNTDIQSAALISRDGSTVASAGDHARHWIEPENGEITVTHIYFPITKNGTAWGNLQLAFTPLGGEKTGLLSYFRPVHYLFALFGIIGFLSYFFYIKRMLKELDPGAVVPERVMSAFNTLAEGVLILDDRQQIVLANNAFTDKIGQQGQDFRGRDATSLGWDIDPDKSDAQLPWTRCIEKNDRVIDQPLRFGPDSDKRVFMVNATPIGESKTKAQGVLVTFDDITDLDRKRQEQSRTLARLEKSEQELQNRTIDLERLASRDPLTSCFNRRSFFEHFNVVFADSRTTGTPLGCLMVDVDKFKNVNDTYGHHVGDQVIKFIADTLRANSRSQDIVGRMGGEEFCMVLPGVDAKTSVTIAERIRNAIEDATPSADVPDLRITSSFGLAQIDPTVEDPADFVNRSDEALYTAKETGRNRTVLWSVEIGEQRAQISAGAAASIAEPAEQPEVAEAKAKVASEVASAKNESAGGDSTKPQADELTGLPSRKEFIQETEKALRHAREEQCTTAVVTIDINSFKRVNTALGHVVGDRLLKSVARDLELALRGLNKDDASTYLARLANDEFGILMEGFKSEEHLKVSLRLLLENLPEKTEIEGHQIILSYAAGVSLFPQDSDEPRALLQNATAARTESKAREGTNLIEYFSTEINRSYYKRLWLESQLHEALERGQFSLHYQPKTSLKTGRIECMEALIRWSHPKVGDIPPTEFISVAENTGFIVNIGAWVTEEACRQGQKWREAGIENLRIAINLSNMQLRQSNIEETIIQTLDRTGFSASLLELEITETAFLNDFDNAVRMMRSLREQGVHFALDDFGTGYSSLNTLKELPFDSIKIDRSFIGDTVPSGVDKEILSAIISIAHTLEIPVVAEGVETKAQLALLKTMNCDSVQGYMFGRPTPADQATEFLLSKKPDMSNAA